MDPKWFDPNPILKPMPDKAIDLILKQRQVKQIYIL
jgi:hypothetical protein